MKGKFDIKSRTGGPGDSDYYIWVWETDIAFLTGIVGLYQTKEENSKNFVELRKRD